MREEERSNEVGVVSFVTQEYSLMSPFTMLLRSVQFVLLKVDCNECIISNFRLQIIVAKRQPISTL